MCFHVINFVILASIRFINTDLVELSCTHIMQFVNGHNHRRTQLAENLLSNQPKATLMYYLIWDAELSQKAADWASHNSFGHNPDLTVESGKYVTGENIHMTLTTNTNREFDVEEALESWWSENKNFKYQPLNKGHFIATDKQVGHYTQMAWANSTYLGCAVSTFQKDKWIAFLVVCYYGPAGNILREYPYPSEGEYGEMPVCPEDVPDCVEREYGDCKHEDVDESLRVSTNMTQGERAKHIRAKVGTAALDAVGRRDLVELHENLMTKPPSKKTPLRL